MYSFYWDVEKDWGLALCEMDTWLRPSRAKTESRNGMGLLGSPTANLKINGKRRSDLSIWGRVKRLAIRPPSLSHQRSPCPTPVESMSPPLPAHLDPTLSLSNSAGRFFAFGLRPILLLPDPLVYHLFTFIDLVLRFTWSLKLSSHLHTISEIESGVFMMEALELVRRWMWVFIRIEWEAVKKAEMQRFASREGRGQVLWTEGEKVEGAEIISI